VTGLPAKLGAALLLCRPGILLLMTATALTGMIMASRGIPEAATALPCITAVLLAAAGSAVINSVLDAPFDRKMSRLRQRCGALDALGPLPASVIGAALISASLILSSLCLSLTAALFVLAAVISYLILYTLSFKRRSPFGAVPGGIPGALPVLIGYADISPQIGPDGVILFLLLLLWQPPHFWILALRWRDDYREAALPVLPVVMGERYAVIAVFLYAGALPPVSLSLWFFGYCSALYALGALLLAVIFLAALYRFLIGAALYRRAFRATNCYLALVLLLVTADICLRA